MAGMSNKAHIGLMLVGFSLLISLGVIIVAAIIESGSWWFLLAVPLWVGLVLMVWDAIIE